MNLNCIIDLDKQAERSKIMAFITGEHKRPMLNTIFGNHLSNWPYSPGKAQGSTSKLHPVFIVSLLYFFLFMELIENHN